MIFVGLRLCAPHTCTKTKKKVINIIHKKVSGLCTFGTMPTSHEVHKHKSLIPRKNQERMVRREVLCPGDLVERACRSFRDQEASRPNKLRWMSMLCRERPSRLKETKPVRTHSGRSTACSEDNKSICFW